MKWRHSCFKILKIYITHQNGNYGTFLYFVVHVPFVIKQSCEIHTRISLTHESYMNWVDGWEVRGMERIHRNLLSKALKFSLHTFLTNFLNLNYVLTSVGVVQNAGVGDVASLFRERMWQKKGSISKVDTLSVNHI